MNYLEIIFPDCGTLYQGDVFWDGKDNNGNYVQDGVYVYKIFTQNCGSKTWLLYCNADNYTYLTNGACVKYCWGHIPGAPWWKFGKYCCQKWNSSDCAYKITVVK